MARNKYLILGDDSEPEYEADIDAQIARLRDILKLMAPEGGSSALGAMRGVTPNITLGERVKVLANRRR